MTNAVEPPSPAPICVLLVDDHASFRQSLAFMLEREPDLTIAGQADSVAKAKTVLGTLKGKRLIDVAIVDLGLPDGSGVDVVALLHHIHPDQRPKILVLTADTNRLRIAEAVEAGADGVVNKSASLATIFDAIRQLHRGQDLISPRETVELLRYAALTRLQSERSQQLLATLTRREQDVLTALAHGLSDQEIAERLHISKDTVRTHMVNLLDKLHVNSRLQALVFAIKHGAVDIES